MRRSDDLRRKYDREGGGGGSWAWRRPESGTDAQEAELWICQIKFGNYCWPCGEAQTDAEGVKRSQQIYRGISDEDSSISKRVKTNLPAKVTRYFICQLCWYGSFLRIQGWQQQGRWGPIFMPEQEKGIINMVQAHNAMKLRGVQIDIIGVILLWVLKKKPTSNKITVSSAFSAEYSEGITAAPCSNGSMYCSLCTEMLDSVLDLWKPAQSHLYVRNRVSQMDADQSHISWSPLMRQGWNSLRRIRRIIGNRAIITVRGGGMGIQGASLDVITVKLCTGPEMVLAASTIGCSILSTILSISESNRGVLPNTAHVWGNPHSLLSGGLTKLTPQPFKDGFNSHCGSLVVLPVKVSPVLLPKSSGLIQLGGDIIPHIYPQLIFFFFGVLLIICLTMPIIFSVLKNWALYSNLCSGKWKSCNIKAIKLKP